MPSSGLRQLTRTGLASCRRAARLLTVWVEGATGGLSSLGVGGRNASIPCFAADVWRDWIWSTLRFGIHIRLPNNASLLVPTSACFVVLVVLVVRAAASGKKLLG